MLETAAFIGFFDMADHRDLG